MGRSGGKPGPPGMVAIVLQPPSGAFSLASRGVHELIAWIHRSDWWRFLSPKNKGESTQFTRVSTSTRARMLQRIGEVRRPILRSFHRQIARAFVVTRRPLPNSVARKFAEGVRRISPTWSI